MSAFIVEGHTRAEFQRARLNGLLTAQPTAQVVLDGVVPAEAMLGGADTASASTKPWALQQRPAQYRSMLAGWRAGRPRRWRSFVRETDRACPADRCSTSPHCGALATWLPGCRRRECCCGGPQSALDDDDVDKVELCDGQALRHPNTCFEVADRLCSCTAAVAICASTVWRRSSTTCGLHRIPGRDQRDHAAGHRSGRGHGGSRIPRLEEARDDDHRLPWFEATWVRRCRRIWLVQAHRAWIRPGTHGGVGAAARGVAVAP